MQGTTPLSRRPRAQAAANRDHQIGVVPGTPHTDCRVQRLRVDVGDGGVVHVDAEVAEHLPHGPGDGTVRAERAGGAEGHGAGHLGGDGGRDASHEAVFLVDADEQRLAVAALPGEALEPETLRPQLRRVSHVALEQDDGPDAVVADQGPDVVEPRAVESDGEELDDISLCAG